MLGQGINFDVRQTFLTLDGSLEFMPFFMKNDSVVGVESFIAFDTVEINVEI